MAAATNTTEGQVILSGDLTGTGSSPELRATGVTPGSYSMAQMVIDSKGRLQFAKSTTLSDLTVSLPDTSKTTKGVALIGNNIDVTDALISVPVATSSVKGIFQSGTNTTVIGGVISSTTPDATASSKGNVQIGSNISVASGVISVPNATSSIKGAFSVASTNAILLSAGAASLNSTTTTTKGNVQIGSNISVTGGVISVPDATTSTKGVVQGSGAFSVSAGQISSAIPDATTSTKGVVRLGSNFGGLTPGLAYILTGSASVNGVVQVGTNIDVIDGLISVATASETTLGIFRTGSNTTSGFDASTAFLLNTSVVSPGTGIKGIVKPGSGFSVSGNILSANDASASVKGVVQIDSVRFDNVAGAYTPKIGGTTFPGIVSYGQGFTTSGGLLVATEATAGTKGIVQPGTNIDLTGTTISVKTASAADKGIFSYVDNIALQNITGSISLKTASKINTGRVIAGTNVAISGDGTISNGITSTPIASSSVLGLVKIGDGFNIAADGTLSMPTPYWQPVTNDPTIFTAAVAPTIPGLWEAFTETNSFALYDYGDKTGTFLLDHVNSNSIMFNMTGNTTMTLRYDGTGTIPAGLIGTIIVSKTSDAFTLTTAGYGITTEVGSVPAFTAAQRLVISHVGSLIFKIQVI